MTKLVALVVLFLALGAPGDADACSCMPSGPPCQSYFQADAVFIGTVQAIAPIKGSDSHVQWANERVRLVIERSFRGVEGKTVDVLTDGATCGYRFRSGERYLVYAHHRSDGAGLGTGVCSRTRRISEADEDLRYFENIPAPGNGARVYGKKTNGERPLDNDPDLYEPVGTVQITLQGPAGFFTATTDDSGEYEMAGLPSGQYELKAVPPAPFSRQYLERKFELRDPGCRAEDFLLRHDDRSTESLASGNGSASDTDVLLGPVDRQTTGADAPICEVYKISGPTVIAFFKYDGCPNRPYCEDALDDFQFYLRRMHELFDGSAIRIDECYRLPFEVEVRGQRRRVTQNSVGYYLISPDKAPRVELGVVTDADLIQLMNDYFGPDVVNKAVVQPERDLPVEWSSLLSEFAAHDAPAKAYVASKAADATDQRSRALATALLSDWDLSLHSERLKYPMSIHAPKLQAGDRQRHAEVFDLDVEVGEDGRVLSARFVRQPVQTEIGLEVLRIVQASLFRPAFRNGRFVRAEVTLESILHVK